MDRIPGLIRHRRRRDDPLRLARTWWVALILIAIVIAAAFVIRLQFGSPARPLVGYISDVGILQKEFLRFHGVGLADPNAEELFRSASTQMLAKDYSGATHSLEQAVRLAAVPVVFNDLGVLYAQIKDQARALNAFREALARDGSYRPVRDNLERLKGSIVHSADPVSREIEPNDSVTLSNFISVDNPTEGEIVAARADRDTYRVNTPPAPRDLVVLEIENRSKELIPVVRMYDANGRFTETVRADGGAGSSLSRYISLPPNTTFYLQLQGTQDSGGAYLLKVRSLKAFDAFEPNDDIFNARRITVDASVDANIMDAYDTDFYSFVAPRSGFIAIEIRNQSATLIPAVTTFSSDRRNLGFGPDLHNPGEGLRYQMEVQENRTYFLQVWSQGSSAGAYSLVLK